MTELATGAFRTLGPGDAIPNDFVVPYYLDDRKLRISVARVDDRLYAFDDLCTCSRRAVPAVRRPAHGDDAHVPVPRLPVRRHHRGRDQRPGDRGARTSTRCRRSTAASRSARSEARDDERRASRRAAQEEQRAQTRLALGAMLIPLFFVAMFALCIIGTYHKPHPNGIKIGVVGPAAQTAPLRAGIEKAAGSAFDISQVTTVAEAAHDVRQRDLDAAFVPTANPRQPATVIVAGAGGRIVATAAETLARSVTAAQGAQLAVRDVRPLPPGDEIGVGIFMFMIVCTICGYLAATLLSRSPRRWCPAAATRSSRRSPSSCRRSPT